MSRQMAKLFSLACGMALFVIPHSLSASTADETLFLEPSLSALSGKVVFEGGQELIAEKKQTFEHAISKNIGIHLPSTTHIVTKNECKVVGLSTHFLELNDSLKKNGEAIITAPASYDVVFSLGRVPHGEIKNQIHQALETIGASEDRALIASTLGNLKNVNRATFVRRDNRMQLVTNEKMLVRGEKVWRKTPTGAEEQFYHSEEEYLVAIKQAGLECIEVKRPCFFGKVKWKAYNEAQKDESLVLGRAYKEHHPFTIYHVVKK